MGQDQLTVTAVISHLVMVICLVLLITEFLIIGWLRYIGRLYWHKSYCAFQFNFPN